MSSTISGWQDVPLGSMKTYAEKRFGVARDAKQVMFIDWGPGIGCGLYLNGMLRGGLGKKPPGSCRVFRAVSIVFGHVFTPSLIPLD